MSFPGYRAKNHPLQVATRGALDHVDDRSTPQDIFLSLDRDFGPFTVDVAASSGNAKCERFYTRETDGLAQSWEGERVWCNPPYSALRPWTEKAWGEAFAALSIVLLVPSNRCEQGWWQELVEPFRDRTGSLLRTRFLPGRTRFSRPGQVDLTGNRPPFGSVALIWERVAPSLTPDLFSPIIGNPPW